MDRYPVAAYWPDRKKRVMATQLAAPRNPQIPGPLWFELA